MSTALIVPQGEKIVPFNPLIADPEVAAMLKAEMDGMTPPPPPRIKVPSGGGLTFEIPTDDPDRPQCVQELVGVILTHHAVNRWYSSPMDAAQTDEDKMPDCWSVDGHVAKDKAGDTKQCEDCPLNEWGSGEGGRGKACANRRRLYFLMENSVVPYIIEIPSTSLKNISPYMSNLVTQRKRPSWSVLTKLTLKKAQNADKISYSEIQFSYVGVLDNTVAEAMYSLGQQVLEAARRGMPKLNTVTGEIVP